MTGTNCELTIGCSSNPCKNQGICLQGLNSSYQCICKALYFGVNCEINKSFGLNQVNVNISSKIQVCNSGLFCDTKNGHCVEYTNGTSFCKCITSYSGTHCSIQLKLSRDTSCKATNCSGNGNCLPGIFGPPFCLCKCKFKICKY